MISLTLISDRVRDKLSDLALWNIKRTKKLLKKNDINSKFLNNNNLLQICSYNDDVEMFCFLLNRGCDFKHINDNGDTCLHIIVLNNNIYCLDILCRNNIKDIINIKNKDGDTALHISIKNGFYESFSLLLKYGVDILIKDDFDMDAYELLDVFRKKEKFYDSNCNKYSIMFNLLIKEKMKGEIRKI
ncbi:hypothetical protein PFAG_02148 [Plasmodium falciparum Santa Lucia]|uniref:Ankyrin-repeat protein, putative n=10 Tax=Plasmodium falciparum TaxID=5833 RepID=Q8IB85_PLAF7|nr:ankyrin-repeat protein, putative [Plasmodium falciparum 3D7]ETW18985.1 hypothetical protein PFFVO_02192 [Plasmodium falciparum Vietnam Oak-Knoll (FVO)]ETW36967.1 hypothetical protein PFTANZ_02266 [Plasmodium falciparum Tanzania (2000708)]ETW43403.1 hypothetical protein PFNF135_02315 [Plasmodium falciparum NF135/5.C10]ETW49677.1 hypothetical protein PFMALIP_02210 [Plasmodium falciparum MaliPS096_E11]ETW62058.1 hypothetical protein PFMC_02158 [Plasmodium falciparum CAMP/Malaysia]EUR73031.1 h|eukprot:XP_001349273.1 conserved Plasmodium protein, unknown function [Plasmodium falciparum 3D7]